MKLTRLLAFLFAACAVQLIAAPQPVSWKVDGIERHALIALPKSGTAKAPLIFAFHGAGDTMDNFSGIELERSWPEAIVVYPQGLPRNPGYGPGGVWQTEKGQNNDQDLKFFDTALAAIRTKYRVDDARIYAMGFSNGAKLTYLLWAERPTVFAALGPVAGQHAPSLSITVPKPLIHVAGQFDRQNHFDLQKQSIEMARKVNGTEGAGTPCGSYCTEYASSRNAPVMTIIHGGAHVYPDGTSETIVKFFKRFPLPNSTK
jgi:polyhydroxybutyrate depolymerase